MGGCADGGGGVQGIRNIILHTRGGVRYIKFFGEKKSPILIKNETDTLIYFDGNKIEINSGEIIAPFLNETSSGVKSYLITLIQYPPLQADLTAL